MSKEEKPKVRWLDVVQTTHEGKQVFVLRDLEGVTEKSLLVSRDVLILVSLMDGTRSLEEIRSEYLKATGLLIDAGRVESVVTVLDECLFLANAKYEDCVRRLIEEYEAQPFRTAYLPGKSYPEDPEVLRTYLNGFMADSAERATEDGVVGIIAPHIDYARGSEVYGPIYRHLPSDENILFVVFGTCHKPTHRMWSISLKDVATPLGTVRTPPEIGALIRRDPVLGQYVDEWPHRNEHSIELQLPLIQLLMGERPFEVLSVLTGSLHEYVQNGLSLDQGEIPALLESLKGLLKAHHGRVVFLAAADLAHIGAQFGDTQPVGEMLDESKRRDAELLKRITEVDAPSFFQNVKREGDRRRICGLAPIYFVLSMLEAQRGNLIEYRQWTDGASSVSFAGVVFYR